MTSPGAGSSIDDSIFCDGGSSFGYRRVKLVLKGHYHSDSVFESFF